MGVGAELGDVTALVDQTFTKGMTFVSGLTTAGASTTPGQIPIVVAQHSVSADHPPVSQQWIYTTSPTASVQSLASTRRWRARRTSAGGLFNRHPRQRRLGRYLAAGDPAPAGCTSTNPVAQEKALELIFFDLSSAAERLRPSYRSKSVRGSEPLMPRDLTWADSTSFA
jgi:hypothetical protein